jgi:hypothetical protein
MALSDLLLLAAIVLVLAILSAGGYVLMFRKRFSFLKRPYPETGMRFSKRLGVPTEAPADVTDVTIGAMEISEEFTVVEHEPSTTHDLIVPGDATADTATGAMEIAGEFPVGGYEPPITFEGELRRETPSIPWSYGDCKITALVRDPYWLFVYWEINEAKREEIARRYGCQALDESWPVLRIYDATNLYFFDSRHYAEIAINDYANNWYIRTGQPNRTFCIELGRVRPDGSYIFLARSNFVSTPRDQISEVIDEEWLLLPEYATRLYRRIGGIYPGPSSPGLMGPAEYISSPGFVGPGGPGGGISSPMKW